MGLNVYFDHAEFSYYVLSQKEGHDYQFLTHPEPIGTEERDKRKDKTAKY